MLEEEKKNPSDEIVSKKITDQFGNVFFTTEELARGGQGVVYRTKDPDIAIKQPLDKDGNPDATADLATRFQNIRLLPLPKGIHLTMPMSIMKSEPGYCMRLLKGMKSFGSFHLDGKRKKEISEMEMPQWLAGIPDKDVALNLFHYALTGGAKKRFEALYKCASVLARLHNSGLVYGDVSLNNVFIGNSDNSDVWLIDADNLRFERIRGGGGTYTPRLGAPEIVQGKDSSRPRTDCWAFAVMAFEMLTLIHPFIGKKVSGDDGTGDDWDAEPSGDDPSMSAEEQAYAGLLAYVDDEDDDSNEAPGLGLPRTLVLSSRLQKLFQETFGAGRVDYFRRPAMSFWALEFARAFDESISCPKCGMSYFPDQQDKCPFCDSSMPQYLTASTSRWKKIIQENAGEAVMLPHRMLHPFSLERSNESIGQVIVDFTRKEVFPERGTTIPADINFSFAEAEI